jgi:hypothetical protein
MRYPDFRPKPAKSQLRKSRAFFSFLFLKCELYFTFLPFPKKNKKHPIPSKETNILTSLLFKTEKNPIY